MSKHTPGPWKVDEYGNAYSIRPEADQHIKEDGIIGHTHPPIVKSPNHCTFGWEETEHAANARLIAAAPEMLEALQGISLLQHLTPEGQWIVWEKVTKALAKAEGRDK